MRNTKRLNVLGCAVRLALLASCTYAGGALANDVAAVLPPNDDLPSVELEREVITAQNSYVLTKTDSATGLDLSPKETPQSFTTMTEKQMKDQNVQYLKDALRQSTGVNSIAFDGKRSIFSARGFEVEQFFIDGLDVDFTQWQNTGENLANIGIYDHISIVRGSTGLLAGSGEPSAAITLHRKRANSAVPTGEISVNANNFNNYGIMADVGGGLNQSGTVRGRFVAAHQDGDSYVDREKRGFTTLYGVIDADVGDNTEVGIGYSYQKTKWRESMWGGLPAYYTDGTFIDWDTGKNVSAKFSNWDTENKTIFADLKHHFNNGMEGTLKASYSDNKGDPTLMYARGAVDRATGTLMETAQGTGLLTGNPSSYTTFSVVPENPQLWRKQTAVQGDLKGSFDAFGQTHEWLVGADYSESERHTRYRNRTSVPDLPNYYTWDGSYHVVFGDLEDTDATHINTKESSIYGTLRLKPTDNLAVIVGARASNYDRDVAVDWLANTFKKNGIITPYGGLVFDVTKNHSLYASYASIYKPQDNAFGVDGNLLDPKEGNTVELGWKGSNDDGSLTAQVAVFEMKQKNYPVDTDVEAPNSRPWRKVYYKQGADATSRGFEMEVSGRITPQMHATLGFSHVKVTDGYGEPMMTTHPTTKVNAFGTYTPVNMPKLTVGAGFTWNSERYGMTLNPVTGNADKLTQKPVFLANLMAKYQFNDNWDAQVNVNNVFNKKYFDINDEYDQVLYQEPLSVVGRISYKF